MMDEADREENELLLAPATKAKRTMDKIQAATVRIFWNRIYLIILLVVLVIFGLYSESQIMVLQTALEDTEQQVAALQILTEQHEKVIERFSESITNGDVLQRLQLLEQNMTDTQLYLKKALQKNEDLIQNRLDKESKELHDQVDAAEAEIHNKVSQVEDDIRKYDIETKAQFSMENSFMVYQLAGTFTLLSCLISMWHMTAHLRKLNQPMVQRKILAILWMSPVYAITSWFSLVFPKAEGYLAIIKDGYEAYIIYQFLSFCIAVIGKGDRNKVVDILATHADHLTPPFRFTAICEVCGFCKPPPHEDKRQLADEILLQCQFFALQFVFFRPLTTTAMVFLNQFQYYGGGEGPMDYRAPQLYLTIIQNVSIFVAFTGLLKFYHAVDNELAWCRPLPKFLCIKGVVFMTFWQGLVIAVLAEETSNDDSNAENWADSAQNFLICLEMLLFSIAHFYCFPTEEWQDGYRVQVSKGQFGDSIALGDFFSDIKLILRNNRRHKTPKRKVKSTRKIGEIDPIAEERRDLSERTTSSCASETEEDNLLKVLTDSLGDDATDPEIAKATRRLLKSNVLSPDLFGPASTMQASPTNTDIENARRQLYGSHDEGDFENDEEEDEEDDETDDEEEDEVDEDGEQNDEEIGGSSSESGGNHGPLVSHQIVESSFMEALRPSILTTVASLAEMERRAAEQMNESKPSAAVQTMDQSKQAAVDDESSNAVDDESTNYVPVFSHDESGITSMEALRPSIFTTVASLAELERKSAQSNQGPVQTESNVAEHESKPYIDGVCESDRATVQPENDVADESFETTVQIEDEVVDDSYLVAPQTSEASIQGIAIIDTYHRPVNLNNAPVGMESAGADDLIQATVNETIQATAESESDAVHHDFSYMESHFSDTHH